MRLLRRTAIGALALALVPVVSGATATAAQAKSARPTNGIFVSLCNYSHSAPDDPIVHAGMAGMSHLHDFFGNRSTDSMSTLGSLAAAPTTCRVAGDHAAYWAPALYAGGTRVRPNGVLAYFTRSTVAAPSTFPPGLKIVAGDRATVRFSCFTDGMPRGQHHAPAPCHAHEMFAIGVQFPDCWNGVDLDSADHRSHMAYSVDGRCPAPDPVAVPRLALWMLYPRPATGAALSLASGPMSSAHADFFNAWVDHDLQALNNYCLVGRRRCYKIMGRVLNQLGLTHVKRS